MNNPKDFTKKDSGVVVNSNTADYLRARKRNKVRRDQDDTFGEEGKIAIQEKKIDTLESEIAELKAMVNALAKKR